MADEQQLRILTEEGVEAWNRWRKDNFDVEIDLEAANLIRTNLSMANLRKAKLAKSKFGGADLSRADLSEADLNEADLGGIFFAQANLSKAKLIGSNLSGADLSEANLSEADFSKAILNRATFDKAILSKADLSKAFFVGADFSGQNFSGQNFSGQNFRKVQALGTNFNGATFTGTCIEDWHINTETKLDDVICDYIYLKEGQQERRPSDHNRNFEPGEFAALVQKSVETVDLIFKDGIDWQTFLTAFQELQIESESGELSIQAIERKTSGAFIIRVEAPQEANKEKIETSFWNKYQPLLEAKDREIKLLSQQTEFYSQQIQDTDKDNTRLLCIIETMAEKETSKINMTFNAPVTSAAGNVEGNQNIFTSQSITQVSAEIQNRLTTLQNNGLTQEQAEAIVAQYLATTAENDLTALGKSLGNKAAETSLTEVVRRIIKLALNLAGVPLP